MQFDAILVSHGQPSDPDVGEAEIAALASSVGALLPEARVEGVTLASSGRIESLSAERPGALIYPMFMADGWFTQVQLPKRLADGIGPQLVSFGMDCTLPHLAAEWLHDVCKEHRLNPSNVDLVIAGHGSGKSRRVSEVTWQFARTVADSFHPRSLRCGFVEEDPRLAQALSGLDHNAICLPFFAARRGHVLEDLPEAVKTSGFEGIVLDPIGLHPGVPQMIANALRWRASTSDPTTCL